MPLLLISVKKEQKRYLQSIQKGAKIPQRILNYEKLLVLQNLFLKGSN